MGTGVGFGLYTSWHPIKRLAVSTRATENTFMDKIAKLLITSFSQVCHNTRHTLSPVPCGSNEKSSEIVVAQRFRPY